MQTQVSFLASIGIRELIVNAKALQCRGGRMVMQVNENSTVAKTLEITNISDLLPKFTDAAEVDKAARQAGSDLCLAQSTAIPIVSDRPMTPQARQSC